MGYPCRHTALTFQHCPPQCSLPVSFDTVARELSPRTQHHRFVSWKGDVPFIIQMLIALREARERATLLFFTSTSNESCQCVAAEDNHYHLDPCTHQHQFRICFGKALTRQNKEAQLVGEKKEEATTRNVYS